MKNSEVKHLYKALSFGGPGYSLSQMTDTYTKRTMLFCGAEVKRSGADELESLAQLAIWLAAGLRQQQQRLQWLVSRDLQSSLSDKDLQHLETNAEVIQNSDQPHSQDGQTTSKKTATSLPLLGWTIQGHSWSLYVAWILNDGSFRTVSQSAFYLIASSNVYSKSSVLSLHLTLAQVITSASLSFLTC